MNKNLSYVILGAGGTGGPVGAFLTRAGKNVTLIARGKHLEAMQSHGLKIQQGTKNFTIPVKAVSSDSYQGNPDVIFVCVKGYSLGEAAEFIKKTAMPHTVVIPVLNIYGTGGMLQKTLPELAVTDGCIYIAAEIKEPGTILMSGQIFRVVYGLRKDTGEAVRNRVMPVLEKIRDDLKDAEIIPVLSLCIEKDALQKFSFVSPMAAIGACFQVTASAMQKNGEKRKMFFTLVEEIRRLSAAMGTELPGNIAEINLRIMDELAPTATASMQRDIAAGRQSEVDGLIYQVVRLGDKYQIDMPVYEEIAEKLREKLDKA